MVTSMISFSDTHNINWEVIVNYSNIRSKHSLSSIYFRTELHRP